MKAVSAVSPLPPPSLRPSLHTVLLASPRNHSKSGRRHKALPLDKNTFHDRIVPPVTRAGANIGRGGGQNIRDQCRFEDEAGQQQAKRVHIANKTALKRDFLPAGEKREIAWGGTLDLYDSDADAPTSAPFEVTVQYKSLEGKQYEEQSFTLDLSDFEGSGGAAKSALVDREKALRSVPQIEYPLQRGIRHLQQRQRIMGEPTCHPMVPPASSRRERTGAVHPTAW